VGVQVGGTVSALFDSSEYERDEDGVELAMTRRPRARTHDPVTSHMAAASVRELRPKQQAVLDMLLVEDGLTDEEIARYYRGPAQSPSGLRTRRCELVDLGLVRDSGRKAFTAAGRPTIIWEAVRGG